MPQIDMANINPLTFNNFNKQINIILQKIMLSKGDGLHYCLFSCTKLILIF